MKIEERLNVSPYVFFSYAQVFWSEVDARGVGVCYFAQRSGSNDVPDAAMIHAPVCCWSAWGEFVAVTTLPGKSRLFLEVKDADWPIFQPRWERLLSEMRQDGLIAGIDEFPHEIPNTTDVETLNNWWEKRGKHQGMTLKQVAAKSGVPYSTITNWRHANNRTNRDDPGE